jgi:hypothetical protein
MAVCKTSKSQEAYYARYKATTFASNRKRKLERVVKEQPNNEQAKMALKDIHYRRKTPNTSMWSHSDIALAKLFKEFTGNFNQNILSSNPKTAIEALQSLPSNAKAVAKDDTVLSRFPFSLKARVTLGGVPIFAGTTTLSNNEMILA